MHYGKFIANLKDAWQRKAVIILAKKFHLNLHLTGNKGAARQRRFSGTLAGRQGTGRRGNRQDRQGALEPLARCQSDDCSPRLPSVLYSTGKAVKFGYQVMSARKQGCLWESMFPSAKSDLGAHRIYEDSLNEDLDTPVKVEAEILRRLILAAREGTGEDPRKSEVVITFPASFETGQRKDTLLAAELAGLNVGDGNLMNEPNAAFLDLVNSLARSWLKSFWILVMSGAALR
jgi:molecular chaperone DnaK (HSP70)